MPQNTNPSLPEWVHHFNSLESTNNYAMQLIKDGMAYHGCVIWADQQTNGRGQRGKNWQDNLGNLKLSLILSPDRYGISPFHLSMLVAVSLTGCIKKSLMGKKKIFIKWPNDIYISDKKTCGVLIENSFRGEEWKFAVIGIGLNVNQLTFPEGLSKATSLSKEAEGAQFNLLNILISIRESILQAAADHLSRKTILKSYNDFLFKRGELIHFKYRETNVVFEAKILEVQIDGQLLLQTESGIRKFWSGSIEWLF